MKPRSRHKRQQRSSQRPISNDLQPKQRRTVRVASPKHQHSDSSLETDNRATDQHDAQWATARTQAQAIIKKWLTASQQLQDQTKNRTQLFSLDPWQKQAVDLLASGDCVVVDAPTTAGKTRVIEAFFRDNLQQPSFRAAYTTPVKSLSNDKLREFRAMFGADNVGIATGDIKENLTAPIVVATLESYRNSLLGIEPDLGRSIVVFDEYHYLQDEGRGSAWEESIILTPRSCQLLLLSASVDNADEFCQWIESLGEGRTCRLVRTLERPVPLESLVWHRGGWLLPEALPGDMHRQLDRHLLELPLRQEQLVQRLTTLIDMNLVPCIVYAGKRLACENLATLLARQLQPLPEAASVLIGEALQASQAEFSGLSFLSPKLRQMLQVYGIGYHHSGLAGPARMTIEALVKQGLLRFCTATMGLSLGINFAVRSAVISDYSRPSEQGLVSYTPSEVLQMLGRAGRRGRDRVGFSLWPTTESYVKFGNTKRDRISSRLRHDPTTFLGLIGRGFSLRAIENFYSKSLRHFQDKNIDLSLISKSRLEKKLPGRVLPCQSPAAEFARFRAQNSDNLCLSCPHREPCHDLLKAKAAGPLTALHLHLHAIEALTKNETLTEFGQIARYFPQAGGLLIARMIARREITDSSMMAAAELVACLALARFKEPKFDPRYRFPFNAQQCEREVMELYPDALFPDVYDPPFGRRLVPTLREFNIGGGAVVQAWLRGTPWPELMAQTTNEAYGTGDLMSLFYRVATYLQSMAGTGLPGLTEAARAARAAILREPMSLTLTI